MKTRVKTISRPIKYFVFKLLLSICKGLSLIAKSFFNLLKNFLGQPVKWVLLFIYKNIIINIYKALYYSRKIIKIIFPTETVKPLYLFINKYITHIIIIVLVVTISFANIFTTETRAEGFGEKSILFALAMGSNLEDDYIEETISTDQPRLTSYLENTTTSVSATQKILTTDEPSIDIGGETMIASEGDALVKPEISSIEASKKTRDKPIEYTVMEGDTLSTIAENFGISTSTILWENSLSKFSIINPGLKLTILPTDGLSHKVASGDTLSKIAKKYQAEENKIIEFNKLASAEDLQTGQLLIVPEGQPYYAPVSNTAQLAPIQKIFTSPGHVEVPSSSGKMAWPTTTHRISQYYSWRHIGLDIDGEFGDLIWAADDGVITKVAYLNYGYGYHVIIDHGGGKSTLYAHFQKIYVAQGQAVARGDVLGEMGSTGYSTGSHLHFEVRYGSTRYNPLNYIK